MAESPIGNIDYAGILFNIQTNGGDESYWGAYRQWYKDVVQVFIGSSAPPADASHDELDGWLKMDVGQLAQATKAFVMWDEIIGISVSLTSNKDDADITFAYSTTTNGGGTYASPDIGSLVDNPTSYPHYEIESEYIWMASNAVTWPELTEATISTVGGRGFNTYLHEIGHSFGLTHPGRYNANDDEAPDYSDDALMVQDSGQYTIMSYFGDYYDLDIGGWAPPDDDTPYTAPASNRRVYWQTPTMYDMAAVQEKYGAETTTRTGDTTYGFNAAGIGTWTDIYDFNTNKTPLLTIYDSEPDLKLVDRPNSI